jgi:hypothetical protein
MGRFRSGLLLAGAVGCATVVALPLLTPARAADMATYYHAGAWDAFSGRGDDGHLVCGVGNTNPADSRRVMMRFTIGGQDVTFTASKPDWNIPANSQASVVMQVGLNTPWTEQATGNGHELSWTLDRTSIQSFDAQFRASSSMTLTFPNGNEPPWSVPLTGSTMISNAFGKCITDLTARSQASSPVAVAQPSAPTQPVAVAPAAPAPATSPAPATPPAPAATSPTSPTAKPPQ